MDMITRFTHTLVSVASLAAFGACMDEPAGPEGDPATAPIVDDIGLNPIGIAHRANGNDVRFYEPGPGQILTVELGNAMPLAQIDDAVAMFRAAQPEALVPSAIAAAQLRSDAASASAAPAAGAPRQAGLSIPAALASDRSSAFTATTASTDPCEPNNFVANECTDGDQEWCKITWSNGFFAFNSSVDWTHNAVCPLSGTLTMRLLVDSDVKGSFTFSSGIGRYIWHGSNFSMRQEVINASGSTFRVGGAAGG
jgi:hypothetical protein